MTRWILTTIVLGSLASAGLALPSLEPGGQPPTDAPTEEEPRTWIEALGGGEFSLNLRYRFERVEDDGFDEDALASTLRTTLGYTSAPWRGLWMGVQAENVSEIGFSDEYRNAGAGSLSNGVTDRPTVADPGVTELNHAYLGFRLASGAIKVGRIEVSIADQRFVGSVGWRQHHQTFDGAVLNLDLADDAVGVTYLYIDRAHRIFGDRKPMSSHALDVTWTPEGLPEFGAYAYLLDYDRPGDQALSTLTVGLRASGQVPVGTESSFGWKLQAAQQEDAADNPFSIDATYLMGEGSVQTGEWTFGLGFEELGGEPGDGRFTTPLATLHKFNGWADRFLGTPSHGLQDLQAFAAWKSGSWASRVVYHRFDPASGSGHYGDELDGQVSYKTSLGPQLLLKGALYDADQHSVDVTKLWLQAAWGF